MFIVIAKRQRDTLILNVVHDEDTAVEHAQNAVIAGTVAEAHVIEAKASFFESSVNRTNPDQDTSRAQTAAEPEPTESPLNPGTKKTTGKGSERPEVSAQKAEDLQQPDASNKDRNAAAPKK